MSDYNKCDCCTPEPIDWSSVKPPVEDTSVFINNEKPELIFDHCECQHPAPPPKPPKHEYSRKNPTVNMPYSDKPIPGPFVPDYDYYDIKPCDTTRNVPNTYLAPGHHCDCHDHCHDRNPHPMDCCHPEPPHHHHHHHCGDEYVTRHELNKIISNIARADIFRDLSEDGTTVSVGGIRKGTKFNNITFSRLVELMLYPQFSTDDEDFACETASGRTVLNSTVKYPMGDLKEGDSLKGMTVSQILEAMLCGKNHYGTYLWKSDVVTVPVGTTTLDAEELFEELVADYSWKHAYEMLVVCKSSDKDDETKYKYDEIIANLNNKSQKTNVSIEGVPEDIKWSYNPESKKITLHTDTQLDTEICIVLVRR